MQNFYSTYYSHNSSSLNFYLYFESNELVVFFPLKYGLKNGFAKEMANYENNNQVWCIDEKGEKYKIYKPKCRRFYRNIKKAKSSVFDNNYKYKEKRTIFMTEFYIQYSVEKEIVFSICIEFNDPLSNQLAYICSDVNSNSINYNFDNFNNNLNGYFFINSVGFSHSFYFPGNSDEALTVTENIYNKNKKFKLYQLYK